MNEANTKLSHLKRIIEELGEVVVAFSGGVDSTFLAKIAYDILGEKATAISIGTENHPADELDDAIRFAKEIGINHHILDSSRLDTSWFKTNPRDRCYICKRDAFRAIIEFCNEKNIQGQLIEGSNYDDRGDFRPGFKAIKELAVRSPLLEAKLTKEEIRQLSKTLGLSSWNKPAMACLATRFPFGVEITPEKLAMVREAEKFLRKLGLTKIRVRVHNELARIETDDEELNLLLDHSHEVVLKLKELGFVYVALDLEGYQMGSMNKTLTENNTRRN